MNDVTESQKGEVVTVNQKRAHMEVGWSLDMLDLILVCAKSTKGAQLDRFWFQLPLVTYTGVWDDTSVNV